MSKPLIATERAAMREALKTAPAAATGADLLLRLLDENDALAARLEAQIQHGAAQMQSQLAMAEKLNAMHRRAQAAEAIANARVEDLAAGAKPERRTFGRALANYAAATLLRERDEARAEIDKLNADIESLHGQYENTLAAHRAEVELTVGHADGTVSRADIVYRRGYETGKAESLAEVERVKALLRDERDAAIARAEKAEAEVERLRAALMAISAIRDSIVGTQQVNWSAHVYPLVAALDAAGYAGVGYAAARVEAATLIEQRDAAIARAEAAEAQAQRLAEDMSRQSNVLATAERRARDSRARMDGAEAKWQQIAEAKIATERAAREKAEAEVERLRADEYVRASAIGSLRDAVDDACGLQDPTLDGETLVQILARECHAQRIAGTNAENALARLTRDLAEARRERDEALDAEQARWQNAIAELLSLHDALTTDGTGCESGDPLDVSLAQIRCALGAWEDRLDEAQDDLAKSIKTGKHTVEIRTRERDEARELLRDVEHSASICWREPGAARNWRARVAKALGGGT